MSDEEDDYMSAVFVDPKADEKPTESFNNWRKRKLNMKPERRYMEREQKRPKSQKALQEETREKGLSTTVMAPDNLGFKLMAKMGYKSGEGLGKSNSGRKEPIPIAVKSGRSGLGKEAREKERMERRLKVEMAAMKARQKMGQILQRDFRSRMRNQFEEQKFERDLYKSQKVCHQLDGEKGHSEPISTYYWPDAVMNKGEDDVESGVVDYDSNDEDCCELTAEEKLIAITSYLRDHYFYCLWCAIKYDDQNDMEKNCPGNTNALHEDD